MINLTRAGQGRPTGRMWPAGRKMPTPVLVAPDRVGAPWYSEMTQMKVGQPWAIPQFWGAMSQGAGAIGASPNLGRPLQAWLLRGTG